MQTYWAFKMSTLFYSVLSYYRTWLQQKRTRPVSHPILNDVCTSSEDKEHKRKIKPEALKPGKTER